MFSWRESFGAWEEYLIQLLGGSVPLPKTWSWESSGPFLKQKGKHCLFINNFSPRLPVLSPQRHTSPVWNCQAGMIKQKCLPASCCTLQNRAVFSIKHTVASTNCKNPLWEDQSLSLALVNKCYNLTCSMIGSIVLSSQKSSSIVYKKYGVPKNYWKFLFKRVSFTPLPNRIGRLSK